MTTVLEPRTGTAASRASLRSTVLGAPATAVVAIWLSTALVSVFAPDMVSGSEHEHLPIAALTVWLWASLATAYTLLGARGTRAPGLVAGVCAVWLAVLVAAVWSPVMVTGSDPTRIPVAVLVAPVVAAVTTGFLALHQATSAAGPR